MNGPNSVGAGGAERAVALFSKIARIWPWGAAVLSGVLYAACFAPFNQGWLCWIALGPLLTAIWFSNTSFRRRWQRDLLLGYVAGFVFFTITFSWLGALGTLFQNVFLHGLPALLALYLALFPAVWACLAGSLRPGESAAIEETESPGKWDEMLARAGKPVMKSPRSPWLRSSTNLRLAFCLACVWVALEWIRGWLFGGFGWNGLGVALHSNLPVIQIAEFTGVGGLTFAIVFANVIAVSSVRRFIIEVRDHQMRPHYDLTLSMAGIVGLLAFGMHSVQSKERTTGLRVAAIQPNIPQQEKFDPHYTARIFEKFSRLTEIALHTAPPPDLVVWPESSMPDVVRDPQSESNRFVTDLSAAGQTDLLLGAIDLDGDRAYNAALLISGSNQQVQVYRKLHLVPFGEYVPLRHSFPLFAAIAGKWVPSDFDFGTEPDNFRLTKHDGALVAPLICFEDTIGELAREFVLKGANLIVDVTNDGWFLRSAGSQQHLANAVFRSVETRRPMVRAANTGVTCFVNQFGRITEILRDDTNSTFTEGVLTGDVEIPEHNDLTFYVRHGEIFAKGCAVVAFLTLAALAPQFRRRKKKTESN